MYICFITPRTPPPLSRVSYALQMSNLNPNTHPSALLISFTNAYFELVETSHCQTHAVLKCCRICKQFKKSG